MDCIDGLKQIDNDSIDCIITDPPYNILAIDWDKQKIDWNILSKELFRILKDFGSLFVFCQMPFGFNIYDKLKDYLDFRQDLVWIKNRGFSLCRTVFTRKHENILYFVKDNQYKWIEFGKYIKNKRLKLGLSLHEIGKRCNEKWYHRGGHMYFETGLGKPTREQYNKLKKVLEMDDRYDSILFNKQIFNFEDIKSIGDVYKIERKRQKLYGVNTTLKKYSSINRGRNPSTVLKYSIIQNGKEYFGHPTQKPLELISYLVKASSNEGDCILDCFLGSGTTAVACKQLNRYFIGFDINRKYCKIAEKRIKNIPVKLDSFTVMNDALNTSIQQNEQKYIKPKTEVVF